MKLLESKAKVIERLEREADRAWFAFAPCNRMWTLAQTIPLFEVDWGKREIWADLTMMYYRRGMAAELQLRDVKS